MLENSIIITFIICFTAILAYISKLCFSSKCSDLNCFCLKIHRNTEQEEKTINDMYIPIKI